MGMMRTLEKWLLRISTRWVFVCILGMVGIQSYFLFFRWSPYFTLNTGVKVFDLQPLLTPEDIYAQLPAYTEEAITVYWKFVALDYVFPVTGALSVLILLVMMFRASTSTFSKGMFKARLWLVPLGIIPFDWLENTGFIILIRLVPTKAWNLAQYICWCKYAKMLCVVLLNAVLLAGVAMFVVERILKLRR
jgi:hypothetical protein